MQNSFSRPRATISIVSHGQAKLVKMLLDDLIQLNLREIEIIITINIPEAEEVYIGLPFPCQILRNRMPKGFGANHNAAFEKSLGQFFIVVNPDIRLPSLELDEMLNLMEDQKIGAVVPLVLNSAGNVEDSVRRFPTLFGLARRVLLGHRHPGYSFDSKPIDVDWAAGMFVAFRRESYRAVSGFDDQRFFMYMEDVDICRRLKEKGLRIVLQPTVSVIHDAQRASRRSFKHMRWHLTSALRYFTGL